MFKESIENFKSNYFFNTSLKMVFSPKSKEKFIDTNLGINIDRIEIIKHCGIAFYLKNYLIKYIKAENIYVAYLKEYKSFKIIYCNDYKKKLEYKDIDFNNNTLYIKYGDFNCNNNYSKNLAIGDIVLPALFEIPFKNYNNYFCGLITNLLCEIYKKKKIDKNYVFNKEQYTPLLNKIFDSFGYTIKDGLNINNNEIFLIELSDEKIKKLKEDKNIDITKIIKKSFIDKNNLLTKKIINKTLKTFIEHY